MLRKGFSFVEVLIVLAVMSVIIGVVIVKLRPAYRVSEAYSVVGEADAFQLKRALVQAMNEGVLPPGSIPEGRDNAKWICQYSVRGFQCVNPPLGGVDLSYLVPRYLESIPEYPRAATGGITGYKIYRDGIFFIIEPAPEEIP